VGFNRTDIHKNYRLDRLS